MMAVKSNLCFSTFVFGTYQKYIPYYIYSIARTYPEAYVKIIVDGFISPHITQVLEILKKQQINRFEIVEIADNGYEEYKDYNIRGGGKKLLRWLFSYSFFKDFDYVYFGDVDILILPEKTPLIDFHISQSNQFGLPFSNKVRTDDENRPTNRLTGLHFIDVKNYYKKVQPIIENITTDIDYRKTYFSGIQRDENLLYKINKEAFAFDETKLTQAVRPWHGLHLGITRGNKDIDIKTIEENSSISLDEIKKHLSSYQNDPIFNKIQSKVFVIELYEILKQLKMSNRTDWKWNVIRNKCFSRINSFKKKIKRLVHV
jgi:hypothetical protein